MGFSNEMIEMLLFAPQEQGNRFGRRIFEFAVKEKGIYKIDVNEQNTIASRFYQHKGFKIVSRDAFDAAGKPYPVLHLQRIRKFLGIIHNKIPAFPKLWVGVLCAFI